MTATVLHRSQSVTMTISPGGVGPSTDLARPYIPAVRAADEAFRQGDAFCAHPPAEVIRQIPTLVNGAPGVLAATADGAPMAAMAFTVAAGRIVGIDSTADPRCLAALNLRFEG